MHSIGFTGTTAVTNLQAVYIDAIIRDLTADRFVSGCANGVDTVAALSAWSEHWTAKHLLLVPEAKYHNERLVLYMGKHPDVEVRQVPGGYLKRDDAIVKESNELVAFPRTAREILRSGTWATIRRARKAGVPVRLFPLEGR